MRRIVVIEIGRESIKAAEIIAPLSKNPKIAKVAEFYLAPGVAGESEVFEKGALTNALKELWAEEKFKTKDVALVVSGRRFVVRPHETAHVSLKDFRKVMQYEVSGIIPEQMQNPIIDFYPMFNTEKNDGNVSTTGLVVATPAEPIEKIVASITDAGLDLSYVDFAPLAIARFVRNHTDMSGAYAIVNIREHSTDIAIVENKIPRMVRVASTGLPPLHKKKGRHIKEEDDELLSESEYENSPVESLARAINVTIADQRDELDLDISKIYITGSRTDEKTVDTLGVLLHTDTELLQIHDKKKHDFDEEEIKSNFVAICAGMRGKK